MSAAALVLCGGQAIRLRPLMQRLGYPATFPKQMMPIGRDRKPVLEYVVRLLLKHGLKDIQIVTKSDSTAIQDYFGDGARFGARMTYHPQPRPVMGSADVVRDAFVNTGIGRFKRILVYYGDIVCDVDVGALLELHSRSKAALTLALSRDYRIPATVAKTDAKDRVTAVMARPALGKVVAGGGNNVIVGVSAAENETLGLLRGMKTEGVDFMGGFLPELLRRKEKVSGYVHRGYWVDVGTEENYAALTDKAIA